MIDENNCKFSLGINTEKYILSRDKVKMIKELSLIHKMNILNEEVIKMNGGRNGSVLVLAHKYPNRVIIKKGNGSINFETTLQTISNNISSLELKPNEILGSYYMSNKIPFKPGIK